MCRVRNTHTGAPWTTAYICLTLDESCTDESNNYVDKPLTVRMVQWQPFCVTQPFDPKTPVCAACKKTNRTRSFCRERHKHRQLPWCTVYVLLSALDAADPTTVVAGASKPLDDEKEGGNDRERDDDAKDDFGDVKKGASSPTNAGGQDETASKASDSVDGGVENVKPERKPKSSTGDDEDGDDINDIAESRTFLAKVNCKSTSIHWLELAEYEANDSSGVRGMVPTEGADSYTPPHGTPKGVDPNHANYYAHAQVMGYAQHQSALQNHQQYFFQMQQRHQQHYAAQQAAWQAQYNQQGIMPGGQTPHHGQMSPAPPQEGSTSPAPVTAGEAAAQQQRRNREMIEQAGGQHHQQQSQPPPQHGQQPHQGGQQGQQQQQQWMLYQQMYQAQLPPMTSQSPSYPPQQPGRPPQGQPQDDQHSQGVMMPNIEQQHYEQPMTPENGKGNHDESGKRQRLI
jgi:hypothetical protein